jgi:hypothetical protein
MPSPAGARPTPGVMLGGANLPKVSPTALILALVAWAIGGILLSLPAVFIARSDIRGCREGRYDPAGLGQSQLAFWVAMVNVVITALVCVGCILFFVFFASVGAAGAAAAIKEQKAWDQARVEMQAKEAGTLEKEIDSMMGSRSADERQLWEKTKSQWAAHRKARHSGVLPVSSATVELLSKVSGDKKLWSAIVVAEQKMCDEVGYTAPFRNRHVSGAPAEAPPEGDLDDD